MSYDPWVEPTHPVHPKYQEAGLPRCPGLHFFCKGWENLAADKNITAMLAAGDRLHPQVRKLQEAPLPSPSLSMSVFYSDGRLLLEFAKTIPGLAYSRLG